MWENRCKVAVSGVGFSKVTRSADVPLAAHALTATLHRFSHMWSLLTPRLPSGTAAA